MNAEVTIPVVVHAHPPAGASGMVQIRGTLTIPVAGRTASEVGELIRDVIGVDWDTAGIEVTG